MTHRERVAEVVDHQRPDRCPFQASFTPEFAGRLRTRLGIEAMPPQNRHGGGTSYLLETILDEDLLLSSVGRATSSCAGDSSSDEWGVQRKTVRYTTPYGEGTYTEIARHPLADDASIASYRPPDPDLPELYRDAEWTVRTFGREYWIVGVAVTTIFETAWALRGLDRLLMDFLVDPDLAEAVLDFPYRYHLATATRLARLGVDMIWTGDDFGAQRSMIVSPELWRRFFKPRMAKLFAEIRAANPSVKIAYHSDGNVEPIIPDLIEIGLDVLNPVQPACMDPAAIARRFGRRLALWGTIDEQRTLPFGSPAEVAAEVASRLDAVGRRGALILAPTHNVQLDTPMENFLALVETATGLAEPQLKQRAGGAGAAVRADRVELGADGGEESADGPEQSTDRSGQRAHRAGNRAHGAEQDR